MNRENDVFDIWTKREPLAEEIYNKDNYKIIDNPHGTRDECILYFSSNNIWFPNTEEAFKHSFVENDYYEWVKYGSTVSKKAIFFRDIYKSWYVTGINRHISSIDKLVEFIKKETEGMEVITVGSSAGGYMASLIGALVKAKYVICFSAQFDLNIKGAIGANPNLKRFEFDSERNKYFNIVEIIKESKVPLFYIMPAYSQSDSYQRCQIQNCLNCHTIQMRSMHHGVPVLKGNIRELLCLDINEIEALFDANQNRIIDRFGFSVQLCGRLKTFSYLKDDVLKLVLKKLRRK